MLYCKTRYLYQLINFSVFLPFDKIILKPLVIDIPDLFFKVIAQAYFENMSIKVNISLEWLLCLLNDDFSIKSADQVSSLYSGKILSLLNLLLLDYIPFLLIVVV